MRDEKGKQIGRGFRRWDEDKERWMDVSGPEELKKAYAQYAAGVVLRTLRTLVSAARCATDSCAPPYLCKHVYARGEFIQL